MAASMEKSLPKTSFRKKVLFYILMAGFYLLLFEGMLFAASEVSPQIRYQLSPPWKRNVIQDPVLGLRMSPNHPDHDELGYRNENLVQNPEVLAIGDSLTYGVAAPPDGSWPHHLSQLTGDTVYNAGVGGYGPCEYKLVLDELISLNPETVVLGLYLGNDISNAYKSVFLQDRCRSFKTNDAAVLKSTKEQDELITLSELAKKLKGPGNKTVSKKQKRNKLKEWVVSNSHIYKLARALNYYFPLDGAVIDVLGNPNKSFMAFANRPRWVAYDEVSQFRTVFRNPEWDLLSVNLDDPRINEGMRITQSVLMSISDTLRKHQVRFVVAILHNKNYVYSNLLENSKSVVPPSFFELVTKEKEMTQMFVEVFNNNNIEYIDTYEGIESRFSENLPPYHQSGDHHPNSDGYYGIAQSINSALKKSANTDTQ